LLITIWSGPIESPKTTNSVPGAKPGFGSMEGKKLAAFMTPFRAIDGCVPAITKCVDDATARYRSARERNTDFIIHYYSIAAVPESVLFYSIWMSQLWDDAPVAGMKALLVFWKD